MAIKSSLIVKTLYEGFITNGLQTGDATAPSFTVSPFVQAVGPTLVQLGMTISEPSLPGTVYIVVLADGATAPSVAQIQAGTDASDVAAPSNTQAFISNPSTPSVIIAGLTASTAYDAYITADDSFGNDASAIKVDFTTTAVPTDTRGMVQESALGLAADLAR